MNEGLFYKCIVPNLARHLVVSGPGRCYKGVQFGCLIHQISKRFATSAKIGLSVCGEPDCEEIGTHQCAGGQYICCKHAFRFGFYHNINVMDATCICKSKINTGYEPRVNRRRWLQKSYSVNYIFEPIESLRVNDRGGEIVFELRNGSDYLLFQEWKINTDELLFRVKLFEHGTYLNGDFNSDPYDKHPIFRRELLYAFQPQFDIRIRIMRAPRKRLNGLAELIEDRLAGSILLQYDEYTDFPFHQENW